MSAQSSCLRCLALRAAAVLVPLLLTATTATAQPHCLTSTPSPSSTVHIGVFDPPTPPIVQSVDILFKFGDSSGPLQGYFLEIFEADPVAGGSSSLQTQRVWVEPFSVPYQPFSQDWVHVLLTASLPTAQGVSYLFTIAMSVGQLQSRSIYPVLQYTLEAEDTYFSMDEGSTWCPLDDAALACLLGLGDCGLCGLTMMKIHMMPG